MAIRPAKSPNDFRHKEPQKAQFRFTDRRDSRDAFWSFYQKLEDEMALRASDGSLAASFYVLNFYGEGGVGKTHLRVKLVKEMKERNVGPAAIYNFECESDQSVVDMLTGLKGLREAICDACKKRGMKGFQFPMFDLACHFRDEKLGRDSKDPASKGSLLDNHPFIESGIGAVGTFVPGADAIVSAVDAAYSIHSERREKKATEEIRQELAEMEPVEILNRLPYYFTEDMVNNMQKCEKPLVIFLDTYEDLVNPLSDKADYEDADLWLRRTSSGEEKPEDIAPIPSIPGVLWVILGRNKLNWLDADSDWKDHLECHLLDHLGEADALSFLAEVGLTDKELCLELFHITGGYPLYLDLCVDIFRQLQVEGKTPTKADFGADRKKMVNRLLRHMRNDQRDLVSRLACLDSWDDDLLADFFSEAQYIVFQKTIRCLSFIHLENGVYTMHKVVRDLLLSSENCPPALKAKVWIQAETYYEKLLDALEPNDKRYDAAFASFARYGLRRRESLEELTDFYQNELKSRMLQLLALYKSAPILQCTQVVLNHPAVDSLLSVDAWNLSTCAYNVSGQYQQGVECGEKACSLADKDLEETHLGTLNSMHTLANSYLLIGKTQKAIELQKKLLERATTIWGEDHLNTLNTMHNLAYSYSKLGLLEEAMKLQERVMERRTALLGEDHPDTLSAMNNLAISYSDLGREQEALELREKVAERSTTVFGKDHPDTLGAMLNLSSSYSLLGHEQKALELREKVVESLTSLLGENHPNTIKAMIGLASSYSKLGQEQEAISLEEKALELQIAVLGRSHPDTLDTMHGLASLYIGQGQIQEALTLEEKVLELRTAVLGENHPDTLRSMQATAATYLFLHHPQKASVLLEELLSRQTALLGTDHPNTLKTLSLLAIAYFNQGQSKEAAELQKKIQEITAANGDQKPAEE